MRDRKSHPQSSRQEFSIATALVSRQRVLRIRPMRVSDFEFIQTLAADQRGFTSPPQYVLWMLIRVQADLCAIAEDDLGEPLGYLLAISGIGREEIFVWQLATTFRGRRLDAAFGLTTHLKQIAKQLRAVRILFTVTANSFQEHLVTSLAERVFRSSPIRSTRIPKETLTREYEYHLEIRN